MTISLHIVSTHRADLGHLRPLHHAASEDSRFRAQLIAPDDPIHVLDFPDNRSDPRVMFLQGDRTELLGACMDAIRNNVLIAHAAGGEITKGSTDNAVRDAVTKLAHLHYPVHQEAKQNIMRLGEEDWRICVVGEIGHDGGIVEGPCPLDVQRGDLVVAYHPVTARPNETPQGLTAICQMILGHSHRRIWLTEPNGDPGSDDITRCWTQLVKMHARCEILPSPGYEGFRALVRKAGVIMGNSSAILTEAPMLDAYPILIGTRQEGRKHSEFLPGACRKILDHIAISVADPRIRVK